MIYVHSLINLMQILRTNRPFAVVCNFNLEQDSFSPRSVKAWTFNFFLKKGEFRINLAYNIPFSLFTIGYFNGKCGKLHLKNRLMNAWRT